MPNCQGLVVVVVNTLLTQTPSLPFDAARISSAYQLRVDIWVE